MKYKKIKYFCGLNTSWIFYANFQTSFPRTMVRYSGSSCFRQHRSVWYVQKVLDDVRHRGNKAVRIHTSVGQSNYWKHEVTAEEIEEAVKSSVCTFVRAIEMAQRNIWKFHIENKFMICPKFRLHQAYIAGKKQFLWKSRTIRSRRNSLYFRRCWCLAFQLRVGRM